MIETAIDVTDEKVPANVIKQLINAGQDMLQHPIHLLPFVEETISELAPEYTLVLITKGDLLDQERKLAQSGLGELFDAVEIVSEKTQQVYVDIFRRHGTGIEAGMMVGNSMKSDVIPVVNSGGWGVYVPHELTWKLEHDTAPVNADRYHEIPDLSSLSDLLNQL